MLSFTKEGNSYHVRNGDIYIGFIYHGNEWKIAVSSEILKYNDLIQIAEFIQQLESEDEERELTETP